MSEGRPLRRGNGGVGGIRGRQHHVDGAALSEDVPQRLEGVVSCQRTPGRLQPDLARIGLGDSIDDKRRAHRVDPVLGHLHRACDIAGRGAVAESGEHALSFSLLEDREQAARGGQRSDNRAHRFEEAELLGHTTPVLAQPDRGLILMAHQPSLQPNGRKASDLTEGVVASHARTAPAQRTARTGIRPADW